jgi:phage tail-like protein
MMAIYRDEPYSGMNFVVDLGTGEVEGPDAGLLEVVFPDATVQVLEYRNGNDRTNEVTKTQTLARYGNITLRRGVIGSLSWYEWWNAARNGDQGVERNIRVSLLSEDRNVVLTWIFRRARPVRHHFSPLNALSADTLIESLDVAFERIEME